jgi:small ligand-binding sensory domain FIST
MKLPGQLSAAEAFSSRGSTAEAITETIDRVQTELGGSPDLVVAFFSSHHIEQAEIIATSVSQKLSPESFIGCNTPGVIGKGMDHHFGPCLSLWAARLPGSRVQSFSLKVTAGENRGYVRGWPDVGPEASAVLLVDPSGFPLDPFLTSLREGKRFPTLLGGLLSPEPNRKMCLIVDGVVQDSGAIGFVMDGAARLEPVITQACRPVGPTFEVTRCEKNIVVELDGAPAYSALERVLEDLPEEESARFRKAPHVGIKHYDLQEDSGAGSFLVRGITGLQSYEGTVAIADSVEKGMKLCFHARDGFAAHREMEQMLRIASGYFTKPAGALLFDCTGRGISLFGRPNHDMEMVRKYWPDLPVSGMYASGEIGPLGGLPHIHEFTASLGLLVPVQESPRQ